MKNWYALVSNFIKHCLTKYGLEIVSSWKFELNYTNSSIDQFLHHYNNILKKLANNYQELTIGISCKLNDDINEIKQLELSYLSFITLEINNYQLNNAQGVDELITWFHHLHLQVYLLESSKLHDNELYDTCSVCGYFVYHYLHSFKNASIILPFMDKMIGSKIFNGENGLLTYNGLKKPLYNAYYLLNKLQSEIVSEGDYYIATKNLNRYYILLYYYDKDKGYISDLNKNILANNTYSSQISNRISTIVYVKLKLMEGDYKVRTYVLNEENGCVFSEWMKMGAPSILDYEDFAFLRSKEIMKISVDTITTKDSLHLESHIKQNEVRLIEVIKM